LDPASRTLVPMIPGLRPECARALSSRYAIDHEIGRGGMSVVYLATDLRHQRPVAIKVLHPAAASAIGKLRFLREIQTVAGLAHPNILPLHDSGEAAGALFYVMPFVEGRSLRELLEAQHLLPVDVALG